MRKLALLGVAAATVAMTAPASAASLVFDFTNAGSSISISGNGNSFCIPSGGCKLNASLVDPLPTGLTIDEGASQTFNFALLSITRGFIGGDLSSQISATLAFTSPVVDTVSGTAQVAYGTVLGVVSGGIVDWQGGPISFDTTAGKFSIEFLDIAGLTLGNSAFAPVRVSVDKVYTAAVPEPASWAMMIGGFGIAGGALRRRQRIQAKIAFA